MNLIEFANPSGWWWTLLALPIIAFYILKVRLRRQPVSTLLFWDQVFDEKKPRAWWQQLRHWLSLLLQLVLLLLLVGALVEPLWIWQNSQRRQLLLVIDNSASMAAIERGGQTRFESAKEAAAALIRSLRVGDEMAILTAGGRAAVAIGLTGHGRSLLETVKRIELTDAPSALPSVVAMAKRLVSPQKQSKVILLTDGCDAVIEELQKDKTLSLYGFGTPHDNLAITRFQVRRSLLDASGYQVLIEVSNLSDQPKTCRLDLHLEDNLLDVVPIELDASGSKSFHLDYASASGGRLVAQLDASDGLEVDNRAIAVLPTRLKMPVTLATSGSLFLKNVLESIPLVDLTIVDALPMGWSPVRRGVLVLHQDVPPILPPGNVLVINPHNDCDQWTVGEPIEMPLVSAVDEASPVTQHVRLTNVLFPDALGLKFSGKSEALIKTLLDEPLLIHIPRASGDVLILNVDLDRGDLPLRIAFPVLMKNAVEWFQGKHGEMRSALATGQAATIPLPRAVDEADSAASPAQETETPRMETIELVRADSNLPANREFLLRSPAGDLTPLARDGSTATLASLNYCGLWTIGTAAALHSDPWGNLEANGTEPPRHSERTELLDADDPQLVRIACNLCSLEESNLKPLVMLEEPREFGMRSLGGRPIGFYLAMAGLLLVGVEWWLYQRRVIG